MHHLGLFVQRVYWRILLAVSRIQFFMFIFHTISPFLLSYKSYVKREILSSTMQTDFGFVKKMLQRISLCAYS